MTDQIDVDDPTTPVATTLLGEMVSLRADLNRERWHKRALVVCILALMLLFGLGLREYQRQNETIDRLDETVARLDETIAQLQQTRSDAFKAVCGAQASLINAFTSLQVPPADLMQQWLQQARLDAFEHKVEDELAPLGCDLKLDPIQPPPPPPPPPPSSASTQPSSERAPPTTQPLLFTFPLPTTTVPPTTTTTPAKLPTATTRPPTTTPPTTTPPPKKPKKPKKPKPPHP